MCTFVLSLPKRMGLTHVSRYNQKIFQIRSTKHILDLKRYINRCRTNCRHSKGKRDITPFLPYFPTV